jgi:mono/diheme cytochrome c family protein
MSKAISWFFASALLVAAMPLAMSARAEDQPVAPPQNVPATGTADTAKADQDAENIFNSTCGWCHQQGGRIAGGIGPKLMATDKSDEFILNRIRNGKEGAMPAFGSNFSEAQIQALLRYIRNLKPENL